MRGAQFVGFSGSGKSTTIRKIADIIRSREITVSVLKHGHHPITPHPKEARFYPSCREVIVTNDEERLILKRRPLSFNEACREVTSEVLLVEGFKNLQAMPRVVCRKSGEENPIPPSGLDLAVLTPEELQCPDRLAGLADRILAKGFVLPGIDCGRCGLSTCGELGETILSGERSRADCPVLSAGVQLIVGGRSIPLNRFASAALEGTITGFLRSLKGVEEDGDLILTITRSAGRPDPTDLPDD